MSPTVRLRQGFGGTAYARHQNRACPAEARASERRLVPLVRLELTLLAETDFESVASTNSATGARGVRLEPSPDGRAS
jgi:hypothetical protein